MLIIACQKQNSVSCLKGKGDTMQKRLLWIILFLGLVLLGLYRAKYNTHISTSKPIHVNDNASDMAVFFDYVQERLPQLSKKIAELKRNSPTDSSKIRPLEDELATFKVAKVIMDKDIHVLKQMTPDELKKGGQIWVNSPEKFKEQMEGRLAGRIIGGQNALAFVLFNSAMNRTESDNEKTLQMLKIMLEDKKLDPNAKAGQVFWLKNKPTDETSYDYVAHFSLIGAAIINSFPQALEMLLKYGAIYQKSDLDKLQRNKDKIAHAKEFEEILKSYPEQLKKE